MYFAKLEDSPMFRQQIQCLEECAETLRERGLKFHKGCRKYTEGLGEGYDRNIAFASALETFGGGQNDPISVSFGGPDITKFSIALREIGTYKEILRSQVESTLNERLAHFINVDLQDTKEARKRFDKANVIYDQSDVHCVIDVFLKPGGSFLYYRNLIFFTFKVCLALRWRGEEVLLVLPSVPIPPLAMNWLSGLLGFAVVLACDQGHSWLRLLKVSSMEFAVPLVDVAQASFPWDGICRDAEVTYLCCGLSAQGTYGVAQKRFLKWMEEAEEERKKAILHLLFHSVFIGPANVAIMVREKFLSLRKSTRMDIAVSIEEELHTARSTFEQARFNLIGALSTVEAKKRFEFLEAVSGTMDAHLRYFKQGYELFHKMEPYINQVLAYARQSKESFNYEQAALHERMQEYKRQVDQETRRSFNGSHGSLNGDFTHPFPRSSHKVIEAVMQSSAEGKVQTIKQGYLSKRSSNLRGDWKRRFFVLDSRGMLYYYRKQWSRSSVFEHKLQVSGSQHPMHRNSPSEPGTGLLSRWLSSHYHGGVHDEKSVARHTVNLLTSTIKVDTDQSDLRFCFRIISPTKNYTLQAENAVDQTEWIEKITGVIASLLSSQSPERHLSGSPTSESSSIGSPSDHTQRAIEDYFCEKDLASRNTIRASRSSQQLHYNVKNEKPVNALKRLPGNDICADCGSPEPDWASLNLGVLICIECSGVHRNLGVHLSKVRSLALDVKVWEPSVITLFQALGNVFVNSIWEGLLHARRTFQADEIPMRFFESDRHKQFFSKPSRDDHISVKEKFIHAKYAEKRFVHKVKKNQHPLPVAQQLWESVRINDKKAVYRLFVVCGANVNAVYGQASPGTSSSLACVMQLQEQADPDRNFDCLAGDLFDKASSSSLNSPRDNKHQVVDEFLDGCSLLHLACQTADIGMVELLLQHGADINASDSRGQTPLHQSIIRGRIATTKLLLTRGANPLAVDREGKTPLQLVAETAVDDVEILALLKKTHR
ncbi:hypothetical protein RJ639_000213 [Escallonia herrerae]|uniref:ADP-ribosylation factor GTPase-activating protein AGD3 n=1 Tax=Escallonia herrerae TaxID=1293975 RepID=A0AA88XA60_9ASTE|nr:hypothetical protein RJ639_000213 [Escallonia herrerae]